MNASSALTARGGCGGSWVLGQWASCIGQTRFLQLHTTADYVALRLVRRCR